MASGRQPVCARPSAAAEHVLVRGRYCGPLLTASAATIDRLLATRRATAGGSDAELLDLFRRNKRVLSRSDEDVIAVMTRPR
jgi:hypothetical protein